MEPSSVLTYLQKKLSFIFFDRESPYIRVKKTNLMHYLSSVYFVNQLLHISGVIIAHHQEVHCIYTAIGTFVLFS